MRWGWLAIVAGCGFSPGAAHAIDDATRDAPADVAPADVAPADIAIDAPILSADAFACSAAGLACPGGVTSAVMCNNDCWVSCSAAGAEAAAAKACSNWGGRLAPLQTAADQNCVHLDVLAGRASWIGFEQAPGATTLTAGWSWNSDGQPVTYTNWSPGQPNDLDGTENGQEQCAYMSTSGTWQDLACDTLTFANFSCRHGP